MAGNVYNVCHVKAGTAAVGTVVCPILWAPSDTNGGGITILKVTYSSPNAIAAASAPQPTLITIGTDSAVNGTICAALGSAAYTAGTIRAATVSSAFVDADYGVAVRWALTAANGDETNLITTVQYVMGR